jgi:hypothetical protein
LLGAGPEVSPSGERLKDILADLGEIRRTAPAQWPAALQDVREKLAHFYELNGR